MITNTEEFFQWAFQDKADDEFIVVCVANKYEKEGKSHPYFAAYNCADPLRASTTALKYVKQNKDVFYTLNTFAGNVEPVAGTARFKTSRLAAHAKHARIIGFDVDCGEGKPYSDWTAALAAAVPVLQKLGLNKDQYTFVKSGGGLHGYLRLSEFITKQEWIRLTSALKAFFLSTELEIDKSKICDPAMLLRPVGTFNYKKEERRLVEALHCGTKDLSPSEFENLVKDFLIVQQAELPASPSVKLADMDELPSAIIDNSLLYSDNGFKPHHLMVQNGCAQIKAMSVNAAVPEPLWYSTLGVASATSNPEEAAIAWSRNYAGFNRSETLTKMQRWIGQTTGPATCAQFKNLNPSGCQDCKFAGKIKTPLQVTPAPVTVVSGFKEEMFECPPNYKIVNGAIVKFNEDLELPVSDYLIYLAGVARLYDIRKPVTYLKLRVKLPRTGWTTLEIDSASLSGTVGRGGESFPALMAGLGVVLHKKQMGFLQEYVTDAFKHFQANKDVAKISTQMGWTEEGHFIYGMNEYKGSKAAPEPITPQGSSINIMAKAMQVKGKKSDWLEAIRVLAKPGLELHAFGYLLAYGGVLFGFTGLHGAVINFYSEHTGSGKSTSPRCAMSVFGNPDTLTGGKSDTDVYTYSKLASLNNIPAFTDEISDSNGDSVSNFLYSVSEGHEKGRGDRDGEAREVRHWDLLFLTSSNKSMYDKLDTYTTSSAGQKARLVELNIDPSETIKTYGRSLNLILNDNHGHAAAEFINRVVDINLEGSLAMQVRQALFDFTEHFKFTFEGEERFIGGVLSVTWFAAKIAKQLGLCPGINPGEGFDLDRIFEAVIKNVKRNRSKLIDAIENASEVVNHLIAKNQDCWIKISTIEGQRPSGSAPRGSIWGRIETHYPSNVSNVLPTYGRISISVDAFKSFCRDTSRPFHKYMDEFRGFRNFSERYLTVTSGVQFNIDSQPVTPVRLKCISFDLPVDTLESLKSNTTLTNDFGGV